MFLMMIGLVPLMMLGCFGNIKVNREFQKYNMIYVNWLDLGEENYATYDYGSKDEWVEEIKSQNIALQQYIKKYLCGYSTNASGNKHKEQEEHAELGYTYQAPNCKWNITGAGSKVESIPQSPTTIVIKFSNVKLNPDTTQLRCEMGFYDGDTGQLIKQVHEYPSPMSYNPFSSWSNASFSGKLSNSMYGIAYDIKYYLTNP